MFTYLFDKIFPALGTFFGLLAGLAELPFSDFLEFFVIIPDGSTSPFYLTFTNVFNGNSFDIIAPTTLFYTSITSLEVGSIVATAFTAFISNVSTILAEVFFGLWLNIMGLSIYLPTWVCFLALSPLSALTLGILKHFLDAVPFF